MHVTLRNRATIMLALLLLSPTALAEPLPIRLNVVIHDDVPEAMRERLESDYFAPWVKEMQQITDRRIDIRFNRDIPGISDLDYRIDDRMQLAYTLGGYNEDYWANRGSALVNRRIDKTLLVVTDSYLPEDPTQPERAGEAELRGPAGWASLKTYSAVGHELGHMFGATHENAQVMFNGWFCESYTYPERNSVRSNCYRYSDKNREAIAAYLSEAP
jgi:Metallo-peptidase family M12B Reprolysin-like